VRPAARRTVGARAGVDDDQHEWSITVLARRGGASVREVRAKKTERAREDSNL